MFFLHRIHISDVAILQVIANMLIWPTACPFWKFIKAEKFMLVVENSLKINYLHAKYITNTRARWMQTDVERMLKWTPAGSTD